MSLRPAKQIDNQTIFSMVTTRSRMKRYIPEK